MFNQLTIKDFRGFESLELTCLQRVNLIVGRNNAGKTSLLEGIAIVADPRKLHDMPDLLRTKSGNVDQRYFRWLLREQNEVKEASLEAVTNEGTRKVRLTKADPNRVQQFPEFKHVNRVAGIDILGNQWTANEIAPALKCTVVSVEHRSPDALVKLFAAAVKQKEGEERIEGLLTSVDDRIQKVRVYPFDDGNHIMVDIGLQEMLPVSQVGQGINRLISIFSGLIGDRPDICIIDEIENGIHHSMLEQVWTGIAAAAEKLNIQVFATTHSHECIEAAHKAFAKRPAYDFSIIQLFRVESSGQGRVLDRKHIEAALAGEIDIR